MSSISELLTGALDTLREWLETGISLLPNIVLALVVGVGTAWVARRSSRWAGGAFRKRMDNKAAAGLLGRLVGAAMALGGLFVMLSLLHLDKAVTSILAGVGVAGVALGFALQETASNFVSGLIMAVKRPFHIGDAIKVNGYEGNIQAIELRYCLMRTYDGLIVSIPNNDMLKNPVLNYTSTDERRVDIPLGVAYGDDLELARRVLREAVEKLPMRDTERDVDVLFTEFGDSSINLEVRFWLARAETAKYLAARSEGIIALKKACDESGLTIPFPIRTLDFDASSVGGAAIGDMEMQLRSVS